MCLIKTLDFNWAHVLGNYMIKYDFTGHEVSVKIWYPWFARQLSDLWKDMTSTPQSLQHIKTMQTNLVGNPRWWRWSKHNKRLRFGKIDRKFYMHNSKSVQWLLLSHNPLLDPVGPFNSCTLQGSSTIKLSSITLLSAPNRSLQALDEMLAWLMPIASAPCLYSPLQGPHIFK